MIILITAQSRAILFFRCGSVSLFSAADAKQAKTYSFLIRYPA
jgi:hypothetical protein